MIILIASQYPFEGGEPFLHNELQEIAQYNEKVMLYPIERTHNKIIYQLPDNVELRKLEYRTSILEWIKFLGDCIRDEIIWDELSRIQTWAFLKKYKLIKWRVEARRIFEYIYRDLKDRISADERIVIYSYWMHIHALVAYDLKKHINGSVFITRCHGYDLYEFRGKIKYLPFRKKIIESAAGIFPVSKAGEAYLKRKYKGYMFRYMKHEYLGTIDNGINPYSDKVVRFVSCSNLLPVKRVNLIIEAFALIPNIKIEWFHFGEGSEREKLTSMAKEMFGKNIQYSFMGQVPNGKLMEFYQNNSVSFFVNTSISEGLPVSIMEAISFGIPVIATDVGGNREIVKDGINGFLVKANINPKELADVFIYGINLDNMKYDGMREQARNIWEKKFDAKKNYQHFYNLIHLICDKGK